MSEPFEAIPDNNGNYDIELKKAVLAEALANFSTKVLADDLLFRSIRTTLLSGEEPDSEPDLLTDFDVKPNLKDGKYSLCLEQSAKVYAGEVEADSGAVGEAFLEFTTVKHVPICTMERDGKGKLKIMVESSFAELALGKDVKTERPSRNEEESLKTAVRTVLQGVNDIAGYCTQRGVEVVTDDFGRPTLLEELENTFYVSE